MAGDWIKMRVNLVTHPKVLLMADVLIEDGRYLEWSGLSFGIGGYPAPNKDELRKERHAALRITRYVCVTSLLRFWGYANEHAKGEYIQSLTVDDLDEIAGVVGFGDALSAIGWCEFGESGGVHLPEFGKHNTSAEARTSGAAERQRAYRERQKQKAESVTQQRDVTRDVTSQPREEKRREDNNTVTQPDGFSEFWSAYPRKASKPAAIKAFRSAKINGHLPEVLADIESRVDGEWLGKDQAYIPHPATYLNQRRWEDEKPSASKPIPGLM